MASKPFDFPLIQIRGCKSLSEALEMFPFDYVYKFCLINDVKWLIGNSFRYPQITDMIHLCHVLNDKIKHKKVSGGYWFAEDKGFRITTNNYQIELSYELKTE